jgi:hypothetical protein
LGLVIFLASIGGSYADESGDVANEDDSGATDLQGKSTDEETNELVLDEEETPDISDEESDDMITLYLDDENPNDNPDEDTDNVDEDTDNQYEDTDNQYEDTDNQYEDIGSGIENIDETVLYKTLSENLEEIADAESNIDDVTGSDDVYEATVILDASVNDNSNDAENSDTVPMQNTGAPIIPLVLGVLILVTGFVKRE